MNGVPSMPQLTAMDAVTQMTTAAVYIAIGVAALAQAPRDVRTRVFMAVALATALASSAPTAAWFLGVKSALVGDRIPLGLTLAAFSIASLLLFHFSQVFPRIRPWVRASGMQLPIAYAITPFAVFFLVRWWPADPSQVTAKFGLLFLVFGFPLMVLLGFVLPVASLVSMLRSLKEGALRPQGAPDPRVPLAGIILSQLAGALLGLLVLGPLAAVAPESFAVGFVTITVWLIGLLTPLSFAAAVWKYRVLDVPADPSAEVQPD